MSKAKFKNLFEAFQYIRENPSEYLPEKSLSLFNVFWDEYCFRYESESKEKLIFRLPVGFIDFINSKYKNTTTHGLFSVIKLYSRNEADAFDKFFLHLDEFVKEKNYDESNFYVKNDRDYKRANFFSILKEVKKRPAMYVGSNSFTLVVEMIHGWLKAIEDFELNESKEEKIFRKFQKYIEEKGLPLSSPPWNKIIWYWTMNEQDSLIKFFD